MSKTAFNGDKPANPPPFGRVKRRINNASRLLLVLICCVELMFCTEGQGAQPDAKAASTEGSIANATLAYVGTYTGTKSKGIYLFKLKTENNEVFQNVTMVPLGLVAEIPNPTFLELD